jgi:hypothetical protein
VFGLCSQFWNEDELQIYLLGLKYYSTGEWPFFGPDVSYQVQIPGALQGLLVAVPLFLLPIPESPFILLNILSFSSLCLFAWYCTKRLPELPKWFVWAWLMTSPWTLNYSTHVVNPSYVLAPSIPFFICFLETCPYTTRRQIPSRCSNFLMGLSFFWIMQLHLSWVVLVPYILASFYFQYQAKRENVISSFAWFSFGSSITGCLLLTTLFKYGLIGGLGEIQSTVTLNLSNLQRMFSPTEGVLARFLSLASFELTRWIGRNSAMRLLFIKQQPWLIPFIVFLGVTGIVQPLALLIFWFSRNHRQADWKAIKYLSLLTVLLLHTSFLFSIKPPTSHTFYVLLPIAMIYSFYCWSRLLTQPRWEKFAKLFVACGIIFHIGLAINNFHQVSLYVDRSIPVSAIKGKNFRLLGERRPGGRY